MTETLRERKRRATRARIVAAAVERFDAAGFEATTVAQIAAAAEIGARTYFSYFATKEDVILPDVDARLSVLLAALARRDPSQSPTAVLLDVLTRTDPLESVSPKLRDVRARLISTVPSVRARALQLQHDAQPAMVRALTDAYPDRLDAPTAAALVGAFVGGVGGLSQVLTGSPSDRVTLSAVMSRVLADDV